LGGDDDPEGVREGGRGNGCCWSVDFGVWDMIPPGTLYDIEKCQWWRWRIGRRELLRALGQSNFEHGIR
jgi:hypothetical protein